VSWFVGELCSIAQTPLGSSRLNTTHLAMDAFGISWRDVSHLSDSMARHARRKSHDTRSGVSPKRGLGWTCPPHQWDSSYGFSVKVQLELQLQLTNKMFFIYSYS